MVQGDPAPGVGEQRRHDTKNPLTCCPRCYKAELLGRAARRPVFRYDKVEGDAPSLYKVFHGDQPVATLGRTGRSGAEAYEVTVEWEGEPLRARTLRDARVLVEEAYIAVWREGHFATRGPVHVP